MEQVTILVVDDHISIQLAIISLLKSSDFDFKIDTADNGKTAIEKARENDYDIIFMDISMPEMNGIEATNIIMKMKPRQKIIGVSVHTEEEDISNIIKAGASEYILKDQLGERIDEILNKHIQKKSE